MKRWNFGEFLSIQRQLKHMTLRGMAQDLDISAPYLSDIEKGHRNPPYIDKLDRIAAILKLSNDDRDMMFDLAGEARREVPPDITNYIMNTRGVLSVLRKARDQGKTDEFWKKISTSI